MYSCFTILSWFLPCINVNWPSVYICPLPLEHPPHLPLLLPCRLSQSTSLSFLHHTANSHWLSLFHLVTYLFQYYSQFVPPSPIPLRPQVCSLCLHLHPALQIHSSVLSPRFHMYVSVYDIYISLSDSLCVIGPRFTHYIRLAQICSFLWLSSIPLYICSKASLSSRRWTSRLLLWPIYCK